MNSWQGRETSSHGMHGYVRLNTETHTTDIPSDLAATPYKPKN